MLDGLRRKLPRLGLLCSMVLLGLLPQLRASEEDALKQARHMASTVTVYRDLYGVPHVYGPTDASAVFGYVYARAEDEYVRMEQSILRSSGRAAEVLGPQLLATDISARRFETERAARRFVRQASPEIRALYDAGASALNYYLHHHPDKRRTGLPDYEPWHLALADLGMSLAMLSMPEAQRLLSAEVPSPRSPEDGSNVWAIAPSRTEKGHALLYANPHIALDEVYEGHVHSDEGLNMSGANAYGSGLIPLLGHNEHVAWSLTVNYPDCLDVYEVTFDHPEDDSLYRHGDGYKRATSWKETIRVREGDGTLTDREYTFLKTHHGPIVGERGGKSLAVKIARMGEAGMTRQWYDMAKARDVFELKEAMSSLALVFHNVMAADRDGNIFYVYNGAIPKRSEGYSWGQVLDGSDPGTDWTEYHPLESLPQILNPDCGYIINCNSSPLTVLPEGNLLATDFPPNVIGGDLDDPRVAMSHALLQRDVAFTFEELEAAAFDTYVFEADKWVPRILALGESVGGDVRWDRGLEVLREWDRRVSIDSVGATLFMNWYERLARRILLGGFEESLVVPTWKAVLEELEQDFGTWEVAYGDVYRHQRCDRIRGETFSDDRPSWPTAGANALAGVSFTLLTQKPPGCKRRYGYHGHSYVSVIELGEEVRARSLVPYGASRDPESPHYADQAPLFAKGTLKPSWFTLEEIRANLKRAYHPGQ